MGKKKLNWTEIEARYKSGEPPRVIAEDYQKCTAKQIGNKASKEGWVQIKNEEAGKIIENAIQSVNKEWEENKKLAILLSNQLLKAQLDMIANGQKYLEQLQQMIKMEMGETDPLTIKAILDTHREILSMAVPLKLVVAAFNKIYPEQLEEEDGVNDINLNIRLLK